jgi:hypothetical protein
VTATERLHGFVRRHLLVTGVGAVLGAGLIVFVVLWFEPQKYFLNQTVNEAAPGVILSPQGAGNSSAVTPAAPAAEQAAVLATGEFQSLEHGTSGHALLLQLPDGSFVVRLEDLDTLNGPDLRVYLSEVPAADDPHAYGDRFVDLGELKANKGNQNYAVPPGVDASRFKSVVIWCRRFTVGFGVAPLQA